MIVAIVFVYSVITHHMMPTSKILQISHFVQRASESSNCDIGWIIFNAP